MPEDTKDKGLTPVDDITIEFIEHDEPPRSPEDNDRPAEKKPAPAPPAPVQEEKFKAAEERILRLRADFENFKKRVEKDSSELQTRTQMEMLRKLLPFFDNVERAFENVPPEIHEGWVEGLSLSLKELKATLKSLGLDEIEAEGRLFDPAFHESVGFGSRDDAEENVVVQVVQKGYCFKGKLLRPSKVFINRKEKSGENQEGKSDG